jgi:hypothetical protein
MLVVVEVALSTVLLVGGVAAAESGTPGYGRSRISTGRRTHRPHRYVERTLPGPNRPQVFFRRLLEQVRALPGVTAAGGANWLPLAGVIDGQREISWPSKASPQPIRCTAAGAR